MEGKKFFLARRRDLRARHARALPARRAAVLHLRCRAGEPGQRLHLGGVRRRTNGELVAGWGNLVNRTATMVAKNFGEIPQRGRARAADQDSRDTVQAGFDTVGDLIARHRQRRRSPRRCGSSARSTSTSPTEPYKLKGDERARAAGHDPARARAGVSDCNMILAPFLPHAPTWSTRASVASGEFAPMPRIEEVDDLDEGRGALPGDHRRLHGGPAWERARSWSGRRSEAGPIFTKLDDVGRRGGARPARARRVSRDRGARDHRAERRRDPATPPAPLPLPVVDNHCHLDIARR